MNRREAVMEAYTRGFKAGESSALERAAQFVDDEDEGRTGRGFELGDVGDFRKRCVAGIRALAPPAAAPAAETKVCVCRYLDGAEFMGKCPAHPATPSEPVAPAAETVLTTKANAELRAVARMNAPPSEPAAPAPTLRKECGDNSPEWWTGRWRDWHRGHGCGKDDGHPCTPEGIAEFAAHGRLPGRAAPPEGEGT